MDLQDLTPHGRECRGETRAMVIACGKSRANLSSAPQAKIWPILKDNTLFGVLSYDNMRIFPIMIFISII